MKWDAPPIRSQLAIVTLDAVRAQREAILRQWFSATERNYLSACSVQTTAGFWALKTALIALAEEIAPFERFTPLQFSLGHDQSGAPCLGTADERLSRFGRLYLSVAHTATSACGLVTQTDVGHV